jgi:hypothetical protein
MKKSGQQTSVAQLKPVKAASRRSLARRGCQSPCAALMLSLQTLDFIEQVPNNTGSHSLGRTRVRSI